MDVVAVLNFAPVQGGIAKLSVVCQVLPSWPIRRSDKAM